MSNIPPESTPVNSVLRTQASFELDESVKKDLEKEDPDIETVKAALSIPTKNPNVKHKNENS